MKHVVSFSGGRTSAYLVYLMEQKRKNDGWDVEYIYMDTGAEHPKTYEYIRAMVKHWSIYLTCIKPVFNPELGVGVTYEKVAVEDLRWDLTAWHEMMKKYGQPYLGGAFCTDRLKTTQHDKYCDEHFGKGNYKVWLGMRGDEPKRIFGKKIWSKLSKYKFLKTECIKIYEDAKSSDLKAWPLDKNLKEQIIERAAKLKAEGKMYLAELDACTKDDVMAFWAKQSFDLEIDEWLGNCVFCIKKGINKLAVAAKQESELAREWNEMVMHPDNRPQKNAPQGVMYRGKLSLEGIAELYENSDVDTIVSGMRLRKGCAVEDGESCEVFGCQMDMFEGAA